MKRPATLTAYIKVEAIRSVCVHNKAWLKRFRAFQWITFWYAVNVILIHFYFFILLLRFFFSRCCCDAYCVSCFAAVGFSFLLLVILMIYWMCWHPLLIKIIIHLLNTLRAAYGWMHTYLACSLVHPSIHAFFFFGFPTSNAQFWWFSMFTLCLFHIENFISFVVQQWV